MNKKLMAGTGIVIIILSAVIIYFPFQFVPYTPVARVMERGEFYLLEAKHLQSPEHTKSMAFILDKYGEDYKILDGVLHIRRSLQNDRDLLSNYTFKAEAHRMALYGNIK